MFDVGDIVTLRDDLTDEDKRVPPGWIYGYMDSLCGKQMSVRRRTDRGYVQLQDDYMHYSYNESWLKYYDDLYDSVDLTMHIDELF